MLGRPHSRAEFVRSLSLVVVSLQQVTFHQHDWSVDAKSSKYECGQTTYNTRSSRASVDGSPAAWSERIFGGERARPGELPYQALVLNLQTGSFCGGAIISERHILTAAHCVQYNCKIHKGFTDTPARLVSVVVGVNNIAGGIPPSKRLPVEEVIAHEHYCDHKTGSQVGNDLALVRLSSRLRFKLSRSGHGSVNSICLPSKPALAHEVVQASGWGQASREWINGKLNLDFRPRTSDLLKVNVAVVSEAECRSAWLSHSKGRVRLPAGLVCTSSSGSKGICFGDSGGPLARPREDGRMELIGVPSFIAANFCASGSVPDAHTSVGHHILWIQRHISPWGGDQMAL